MNQDHPFFGNWLPKRKTEMSQGARDFCNAKPLNAPSNTTDGAIDAFQDKKSALKEMEQNMDPEDLKIMAKAMGMGSSQGNGVANRFREALKNKK